MDTLPIKFAEAVWVVYGGIGLLILVAVVGLVLVIRFLFVKFIEAEISKRLQSHQHAQQIEIENIKYRIANLAGRASSIYLKEYEHLPSVWISLNETYRSTALLAGGVRNYPSLNGVSAVDLELFLDNTDLIDWQKDRLRKSTNKTRDYIDFIGRKEFRQAARDHDELITNIDKYAIFFSVEIKKEMMDFAQMLKNTIIEYDLNVLDRIEGTKIERTAREEFRTYGSARLEDLERKIRDRLWDADSAAVAVSPPA